MKQLVLFPEDGVKKDVSSTFADNLSLPIHRWFRYSAGFSALWVRELIQEQKLAGRSHILDPFAGSGTVLLEGEASNVEVIGIEAHPFVAHIARAKLHWNENPRYLHDYAYGVLKRARQLDGNIQAYPPLINKCFPPDVLARLDSLRRAWLELADGSALSELSWLSLASIIRDCSPVGTAQWQYVLPNKTKVRSLDPYEAFAAKIHVMCQDITKQANHVQEMTPHLYQDDARTCAAVADCWADLVITSPPYANNYDYADATRLEMSFWGDIQGWSDLQESVRQHLIPSCTQHVASLIQRTQEIIHDPRLLPIQGELAHVCHALEVERNLHGGKKAYHTMIAAYFSNMAQVWVALRRVMRPGGRVCFVIGDSAPYGIHVPVERWLGELALGAGFTTFSFEKIRDRNIKWQNRKHRVPLQEGRLWVEG